MSALVVSLVAGSGSSSGDSGSGSLYTVRSGDTAWSIAGRFGVSLDSIRANNPGISDINLIVAGQRLHIPSADNVVAAAGTAYTTDYLNLRTGPSLSDDIILTMPVGAAVEVSGEAESGFVRVTYGSLQGWASSSYLSTAASAPATPDWTTQPAGVGFDDYPYKGSTDIDRWGFEASQCTSFVAWRLNQYLGIDFRADMGGAYFGDATYWESNATALGYRVDNVPTPGSIAHWRGDETMSGLGHVAFVVSVNADGSVNVEEYNFVVPLGYSQRTVFAPRFIHFGP